MLLVLALVGAGLILTDRSSSDQDTAAKAGIDTAEDPREEAGDASEGTGGPSQGAAQTTTSTSAPPTASPLPELGSFADQAQLTRVLATVDLTTLERPDAPTQPTPGPMPSALATDRCDRAIRAVPGLDLGDRLAVAAATLAGRRVLVFSHPDRGAPASAPVTYLTVADVETCQIRFAVRR